MQPVTNAPTEDVQITLAGSTYSMRWGILAEYQADLLGVDMSRYWSDTVSRQIGSLAASLKVFSAMVAHNFYARKEPIPSPEHWAMVLDQESKEKTREVITKMAEVFVAKAKASGMIRLQEPAPSQELQANEIKLAN